MQHGQEKTRGFQILTFLLGFLVFFSNYASASTGKILLVENNEELNDQAINIDQLSIFLSAELKTNNLETVTVPYPQQKSDSLSMSRYFIQHPPDASVMAVAWIDSNVKSKSETEKEFISINVYFPAQQISISRDLQTSKNETPKSVVLAAIIAQMIRREKPEYKQPDSSMRKFNLKLQPVSEIEEPAREKFEFDLLASYLFLPRTAIHMMGLTAQFSYFPQAPLAVIIGTGYYQTLDISTNRYQMTYNVWPISAGGRIIMELGNHELSIDLQMLADISHFTFKDNTRTYRDDSILRVNAGFTFGTSWKWYPTKIIGFCLKMAAAYTPRNQKFTIENKDLFAPGSFSARLSLGISFDFSR